MQFATVYTLLVAGLLQGKSLAPHFDIIDFSNGKCCMGHALVGHDLQIPFQTNLRHSVKPQLLSAN
jgi:hypothetical protein